MSSSLGGSSRVVIVPGVSESEYIASQREKERQRERERERQRHGVVFDSLSSALAGSSFESEKERERERAELMGLMLGDEDDVI